jgi:hypothetical protein
VHNGAAAAHTGWPDADVADVPPPSYPAWPETQPTGGSASRSSTRSYPARPDSQSPSGRPAALSDPGHKRPDPGSASQASTRSWAAWPDNAPGTGQPSADEDDSDFGAPGRRRLAQAPGNLDADSGVFPAADATRSPARTRPAGAPGRSAAPGKKKPASAKKRGPAAKRVAAAKKKSSAAGSGSKASAARASDARAPVAKTRTVSAARTMDRQAGDLVKSLVHLPRRVMIVVGCLVVAVLAGAGYLLVGSSPSAHVITVPTQLGAFTKEPTLDSSTAQALRNRITAGASGEVSNVVAAVYEQSTGRGTSAGPQIVVFIGGNITGGGSGGFINDFKTNVKGSFITAAGQLGGQAACAPGANGSPSECAWADNDTFGVVVSATLSANGLADEMRQMRTQLERTAK